jgi:DNA-binding PadR family transcriptional regulator
VRRRPGSLIPIECSILEMGLALQRRGQGEFHGYELARELKQANGDPFRLAAGTLYRALDRMERAGLLESRWEDPAGPGVEGRPPRRLYRLTAAGEAAYGRAIATVGAEPRLTPGAQPT